MNTFKDHNQWNQASAELGTLLGVWAHPDDEAYLTAGLMAVARAGGSRVVVATATKGEAGTDDPLAWPPEKLGQARAQETVESLATVGVTEHRWLGHRDGTVAQVPPVRGVAQVASLIAEIEPDTIVTFGPDGMTGHHDHRTVSDWTTTAWLQAGRPGKLWYATVTPEFHRSWGSVNEQIGFWFEGSTPPSDPASDLAFDLHCSGELLERKFAALAAHRTQTAGLITILGPERYRQWWARESFVRADQRLDLRRVA